MLGVETPQVVIVATPDASPAELITLIAFFFFQAEDGIRDLYVTGVQTCSSDLFDGSEGNYYTFQSITWSPDSKHLVAYRVHPGYKREVHYVESSPADQIQPKHTSRI